MSNHLYTLWCAMTCQGSPSLVATNEGWNFYKKKKKNLKYLVTGKDYIKKHFSLS